MRNVYLVKLSKPIKTEPEGPYFSGKESGWLYVIASSFINAEQAVLSKYPKAEIKSLDLLNYTGIPIVVGD